MKYIRTIGSEIFNVFIYRCGRSKCVCMLAILDLFKLFNVRMLAILYFFKLFNKDIYCPMKGYIRTKNEVYQLNRVRDILYFHLRDGGSKCARMVAILDFFQNF